MTNLLTVSEVKNNSPIFLSHKRESKYRGGLINADSRLIDPDDPNRLNADEFFLSAHLTKRINSERKCFPSIHTLSTDCGWGEEKLRQVLKSLEVKRIISKKSGGGRFANTYTVLSDRLGIYVGGQIPPGGNTLVYPPANTGCTPSEMQGAPPCKPEQEVLSIEELDIEPLNREALRRENTISLISHKISAVLFPAIGIHKREPKSNAETKLEKKIMEAAAEIFDFYEKCKIEFMPHYLHHGRKDKKFNALAYSLDQICSYVDWCRLTGTYKVTSPENLATKIISQDWCSMLVSYCDKNFPDKYDPIDDDELSTDWLVEYFYDITMCYIDKADRKRVIY